MAAILRDYTVVVAVVVVVVVRTRPRAIPLAMITMRESTQGFHFVSHMSMGLRLAAFRAAGAPLKQVTFPLHLASIINCHFTFRTLFHLPRSERSQEMTLQYYNAEKIKLYFIFQNNLAFLSWANARLGRLGNYSLPLRLK